MFFFRWSLVSTVAGFSRTWSLTQQQQNLREQFSPGINMSSFQRLLTSSKPRNINKDHKVSYHSFTPPQLRMMKIFPTFAVSTRVLKEPFLDK